MLLIHTTPLKIHKAYCHIIHSKLYNKLFNLVKSQIFQNNLTIQYLVTYPGEIVISEHTLKDSVVSCIRDSCNCHQS